MKACAFVGARLIGAPIDWNHELDGQCGTIFVADAIDLQSGLNFMYSCYKPSEEEIAEIVKGGVIRLGIMGHNHPVFRLQVVTAEQTSIIDPVPIWDL